MSTMITRVAFCENCFKEHNPHTNQLFLVHGSTSNNFYIRKANWNGTTGYTPHTLRLLKLLGENVVYEKSCAMCEVEFWQDEYKNTCFQILNWTRGIITLKEWNDWVMYKRDWDYHI